MAIYSNLDTWGAPYIYHITVGNKIYIGQATKAPKNSISGSRIYQHFNAAFNKQTGFGAQDSEKEIHNEMQTHRICDICVEVFPADTNYGIPNFDNLVNDFLSEWEPVSNKSLDKLRLDLAEIFHIQWALTRSGYVITNRQMGGNKVDWAIKGSLANVNPQNHRKKKVLLHTDKPQDAEKIMRSPVNDLQTVNDAMRFLFDVAFDDTWPQYCQSMNISLNQQNSETWSSFFNKKVIPFLDTVFVGQLKQELYSRLQDKNKKGKDTMYKEVYEFIKKQFIQPREYALSTILKKVAPYENWGINLSMIMEGLDWSQLSGYVAGTVAKMVKPLYDFRPLKKDPNTTRAEKARAQMTNFKPANFLASYSKKKVQGNDSTRGQWLTNIPAPVGIKIEKWEQEYSVFLFDKMAKKAMAQQQVLSMLKGMPEDQPKNSGRYPTSVTTYDMTFLSRELSFQWLSTRISNLYRMYAPAYLGAWWEFYRPMVAFWRERRNAPEFVVAKRTVNDEDSIKYEYWEWEKSWIEYHMRNAVFEAPPSLTTY